MSKKTIKLLQIGFIIVLLSIVVNFILQTDLDAMGEYIKKAPELLLWLIGFSFFGHLTGAIAWQLCLGEDLSKMKLYDLFRTRLVCENISLFNPTNVIAGDGLKVVLLKKMAGIEKNAVSSVLLSRVLMIISAIGMMLIAMVYLFANVREELLSFWSLGLILGVGLLIIFSFVHLFVSTKMYLVKLIDILGKTWLSRWFAEDTRSRFEDINRTMIDYYKTSKLKLVAALVISGLHWGLGAAELYVILLHFGGDISLMDAISMEMGILGFKAAGAFVPGQIGVEEYANKVMLGLVGVASNEIWLTVSVLRRVKQIFWLALAGLLSISIYKKYKLADHQK